MSESSLIVRKGRTTLFRSSGHGLIPLILATHKLSGTKGCTVTDKIVGLAAAKILAHAGFGSKVITPVCSEKAAAYLRKAGIELHAKRIVKVIMNKEKSGQCPMEMMATRMSAARMFRRIEKFAKNY